MFAILFIYHLDSDYAVPFLKVKLGSHSHRSFVLHQFNHRNLDRVWAVCTAVLAFTEADKLKSLVLRFVVAVPFITGLCSQLHLYVRLNSSVVAFGELSAHSNSNGVFLSERVSGKTVSGWKPFDPLAFNQFV